MLKAERKGKGDGAKAAHHAEDAHGATLDTITSRVNDKYYAVLPHGVMLPG